MTVVLPRTLDADTIPVILAKQLGTPLKGDAQLHLLAGMGGNVGEQLLATTVTTAATAAGMAGADVTRLTNELTKRGVTK
jgi:hypothetical protein